MRPGWERAIARTPSHLTSNAQADSSAGSVESLASIGSMKSGISSAVGSVGGSMRWIIQSFSARPAWNSA